VRWQFGKKVEKKAQGLHNNNKKNDMALAVLRHKKAVRSFGSFTFFN